MFEADDGTITIYAEREPDQGDPYWVNAQVNSRAAAWMHLGRVRQQIRHVLATHEVEHGLEHRFHHGEITNGNALR